MSPLDNGAIERFWRDGFILLPDAIAPGLLERIRTDFARWVDESREHAQAFGAQRDGRPRFSVEPGHSAECPALRRIASPQELSVAYLELMRDGIAVDAIAQLIGPAIRFNNARINSKLPHTATEVKVHQDFAFEPHSNDDLITLLYFLDDVDGTNGPLQVVPESHRGPIHELWRDGVFTGAVDEDVAKDALARSVACTGPAGTACVMHTRTLHGSGPNRSGAPRTLLILTYTAEDALPLQVNHVPSEQAGELVRGESSGRVRATSFEMSMPEVPTDASFFEQQARKAG